MKIKTKREIKGLSALSILIFSIGLIADPLFNFYPQIIGGTIAVLAGIYIMELIMQKEVEEKEYLIDPDWELNKKVREELQQYAKESRRTIRRDKNE